MKLTEWNVCVTLVCQIKKHHFLNKFLLDDMILGLVLLGFEKKSAIKPTYFIKQGLFAYVDEFVSFPLST